VNGPLGHSDWWEDEASRDGSSAEGGEDESTTSEQQEKDTSSKEEGVHDELPFKGKRFCNRGLLAWSQAREAWVSLGRNTGTESARASPIPDSFKKELVKCLADRRHFELSQRISLRDMIDAYQDVWNDEASK
jgi:hypothetical protein